MGLLTYHVSSRACSPLSIILTFESSDTDPEIYFISKLRDVQSNWYTFMNVDANLCKIHLESWEFRLAAVGVRQGILPVQIGLKRSAPGLWNLSQKERACQTDKELYKSKYTKPFVDYTVLSSV